jgi:hypothetical protein
MKKRPQWDDSTADRTQYRLTYAEQLQRKASLVSKNKESAREELLKRQEVLKMGKIPEDIKKTISRGPKKQNSASKLKKSFSIPEAMPTESPNPSHHFASLKKTPNPTIETQIDSLNKLDIAMKELEAAMLKSVASKPEDYKDYKAETIKDDTISEASLFGISDDDELAVSKFSEVSKYSMRKKNQGFDENQLEKTFGNPLNELKTEYLPGINRNYHYEAFDDPIPFENVWGKDSDDLEVNLSTQETDVLKMIEETRRDLDRMNLVTEADVSEYQRTNKVEIEYDEDVIPQKFTLKPLAKPEIPRAGTNSLSIFDHVRSVKIDCRKFTCQ